MINVAHTSVEVGHAYVTIMPSMKDFTKELRQSLQSTHVNAVLKNAFKTAGAEAGSELAADIVKGIRQSQTKVVQATKQVAESARKVVKTEAQQTGTEFSNSLINAVQQQNIGRFDTAFSSKLKELINGGIDFGSVSTEELDEKISSMLGKVGNEAGSSIGSNFIKQLGETISTEGMSGGLSGIASSLGTEMGSSMLSGASTGVALVATAAIDSVKRIWEKSSELAETSVSSMIQLGKSAATRMFEAIETAYQSVFNNVIAKVGEYQISDALKSLGLDIGSSLQEGLSAFDIAFGNILGDIGMNVMSTITSNLDGAVQRFDTMQNFPRIMSNMGVEADVSTENINRLSEAIDGLPTALDDITTFTEKVFPMFNKDLGDATTFAIAFNNALVSDGKSAWQQANAMEQMSQMLGNSKVDMLSWRSVVESMPTAMSQLAEYFNAANPQELYNMLPGSQGAKDNGVKVTMEELTEAFVKLNEEGLNGYASYAERAKTATFGISTALKNLSNRVEKAIGVLFDYVGQSNISGFINNITSKFVPTMQDFSDMLDHIGAKDFFNGIGDKLSGALDVIDEKLAPIKTLLEPLLSETLNTALKGLSDTIDYLVGKATPFIQFASQELTKLKDNLPAIQEQIQPIINTFIDFKLDTLEAAVYMWEQIFDAFTSIPEGAEESPLAAIINSLSLVTVTVSQFIKDISGTVAPVIGNIFTSVSEGISKLEPTIANIVNALAPIVEIMVQQIEAAALMIAPVIDKVLSLTDADGVPLLQHIVETIGNTILTIITILAPHIPKLMEAISKIVDALAPAIITIMTAIEPYIDKLIDMFTEGAVRFIDAVVMAFEKYILPNMPAIMDTIQNIIDFVVNEVPIVIKNTVNLFTRIVPIILNIKNTIDVWLSAIDNVVSGILSMVKGITDAIKDASNWLENFDALKWLQDTWKGRSSEGGWTPFATGGIVTQPTRAIIGEAGVPEAVVPLSAAGIEKFTSGLDKRYKNGGAPSVEVNIGTFVNNDTSTDVNSLCDQIGRTSLRKLREQGVAA